MYKEGSFFQVYLLRKNQKSKRRRSRVHSRGGEGEGGGGSVSLIRNMTAQLHAHPVRVSRSPERDWLRAGLPKN